MSGQWRSPVSCPRCAGWAGGGRPLCADKERRRQPGVWDRGLTLDTFVVLEKFLKVLFIIF